MAKGSKEARAINEAMEKARKEGKAFVCPICGANGYEYCIHFQEWSNAAWIRKQEAISQVIAGQKEARNRYISITGFNPRRVPVTGNDD